MKDSTKKRLIIAGLVAVSVLLIFGISRVLYKEPVQELPQESKPTEEVELVVDTVETGQVQDESESTEETKELVIEVETCILYSCILSQIKRGCITVWKQISAMYK